MGISVQYPSDWQLVDNSNNKPNFIKQDGFVTDDAKFKIRQFRGI
jgi:hypothetical protein